MRQLGAISLPSRQPQADAWGSAPPVFPEGCGLRNMQFHANTHSMKGCATGGCSGLCQMKEAEPGKGCPLEDGVVQITALEHRVLVGGHLATEWANFVLELAPDFQESFVRHGGPSEGHHLFFERRQAPLEILEIRGKGLDIDGDGVEAVCNREIGSLTGETYLCRRAGNEAGQFFDRKGRFGTLWYAIAAGAAD